MARLNELPAYHRPEGEELEKLRERVRWMETNDAERYVTVEPLSAKAVYEELLEDYGSARKKYYEKRITLTGIVSKLGPDEFGAPSFEFTDETGARCYALIVFPEKDIYEKVQNGNIATVEGNVVFIREPYGLVVKRCELLKIGIRQA